MKIIKKYISYLSFGVLLSFTFSCKDEFLERPPKDRIVDANFYSTNEQVLAGTAPLYNIVWFSYNDKASHGIGDGRGGILTSNSYQVENIRMNTTGTTEENGSSWRSFYNIIGQSNTLINNVEAYAGSAVSDDIKRHAIAEGRFMRGLAYSYLVQNWGAVPIITDNSTLLQDTTIARNTIESVWEFIIHDFQYASKNLLESPIREGRLTKWAGEGMLAKTYLTYAGVGGNGARNQTYLDSAAYYAKRTIENSGAVLMPEYADLFLLENNNNSESLFSLQWIYNGDWGAQNSVQAFLAYGSEITGFGDGWGGDIGASAYILKKYANVNTEGRSFNPFIINAETRDRRLKATFMLPGDHYSEITQCPSGGECQQLIVPANSEDDEGKDYNGRVWVKKYIIGRPEDNNGRVQQQRTDIGTYMLRLADVYLVYAEAVLGNSGSTSDPDALRYVNEIRERAGLSLKTSITWDDIFDERLKEFAMEGQAWYDFVRLHYYNPAKAYQILSDQFRGFFRIYPTKFEDQGGRDVAVQWEVMKEISDEEGDNPAPLQDYFPVSESNFYLPLPATELTTAPNLRKDPIPYNFNEGN